MIYIDFVYLFSPDKNGLRSVKVFNNGLSNTCRLSNNCHGVWGWKKKWKFGWHPCCCNCYLIKLSNERTLFNHYNYGGWIKPNPRPLRFVHKWFYIIPERITYCYSWISWPGIHCTHHKWLNTPSWSAKWIKYI